MIKNDEKSPLDENQVMVNFEKWADRLNDIDEIALGKWIFILLKDMPYEKVEAITKMILTFHMQQDKLIVSRGNTND